MVAIAYGHEDLAHYLWCSSNVAQKAKDNSTVLHYAARYGNNEIVKLACQRKDINVNERTTPGNYTALHLATIFRQTTAMDILVRHNANMGGRDMDGKTPRDYATDPSRKRIFEDGEERRSGKRRWSDSEED
ncbi:hypothetical protein GHT06_006135 [Daphnia sinensis]|uniref:Uncharacterized protein n=1 Tax=Daphnia sinensis TaxID=1820382 RepID=A0AAD5PQ81_9CRUS|nr:hypothetical protein GHT06_006135 [Daphnia sinensis]